MEYAATGAAGDHVRAAQLVDDVEVSVWVGLETFCQLLPVVRRGIHSSLPMHAQLAALTNVHYAEQPINGADRPRPAPTRPHPDPERALGADGKWSAVDFQALYHNLRVLDGLIFMELQHRLHARGYQTVPVPWEPPP